jgi:hypothetical protein
VATSWFFPYTGICLALTQSESQSSGEYVAYRLAYFISPHGFGHAARAAAIMAALQALDPTMRFEIFTRVPDWFFHDSLPGEFGYHAWQTDIGLVQHTALVVNLPATLQALDAFLPFAPTLLAELARQLRTLECTLVLCDIAPLGIAAAHAAGLPAILVENFTWEWIYQEYVAYDHRMGPHITYLRDVFATADYHIQTQPICVAHPADLLTEPVSRQSTTPAPAIRAQLGIPQEAQVVLITMGGMPTQYAFLQQLAAQPEIFFIIPGVPPSRSAPPNAILLPHRTPLFHPDLVNTCDAVVGKVGYSTVAEVYHAGIPFGYVPRQDFRESPILVAYIAQQMQGIAMPEHEFQQGAWLARLPALLALPRVPRQGPNGAEQAARFVLQLLQRKLVVP